MALILGSESFPVPRAATPDRHGRNGQVYGNAKMCDYTESATTVAFALQNDVGIWFCGQSQKLISS
jgi:hypothetical protein